MSIKRNLKHFSNRVVGLPHNFLLSCFISGLKPHMKKEVQALQPINLMQAVDFAKLREEKFSELRKYQRYPPYSNNYSNSQPSSSNNPPLLPKPLSNIPVKRLSASKLQDRRDKGLCYSCDEKFIPGHKCKSKIFLLVH